MVKLFPRVEPGFKPRDLGYSSYEALAQDLAETLESLSDDNDGDGDCDEDEDDEEDDEDENDEDEVWVCDEDVDGNFIDNAIEEVKKNPIKTVRAILSILGLG